MPRPLPPFLTLILVLGCITAPQLLEAQRRISAWRPDRGDAVLGAAIDIVQPRGEFAQFVTLAPAFTLHGAYTLDRLGVVQLGGDMRIVAYDEKEIDDTTSIKNMLRTLSLNGRLMLPLKYVHPYVGGSVGAAYFATETQVEECCDEDGNRETTTHGIALPRLTYTLSRGAGVVIDLMRLHGSGTSSPTVSIDVGVADHFGGRVSYHTNGRDDMARSKTDYRVWRLGVSLRGR